MAKATPTPATVGDQTPLSEPPSGFWRYIGGVIRQYLHVPVTVEHGDVIAHDGVPAGDGHWEAHPGPATRQPDNAPVETPADNQSAAEPAPTSAGEE